MSNMSYCRFHNTVGDLQDCYDHIDDELSVEEIEARRELINLCLDIASDIESGCIKSYNKEEYDGNKS